MHGWLYSWDAWLAVQLALQPAARVGPKGKKQSWSHQVYPQRQRSASERKRTPPEPRCHVHTCRVVDEVDTVELGKTAGVIDAPPIVTIVGAPRPLLSRDGPAPSAALEVELSPWCSRYHFSKSCNMRVTGRICVLTIHDQTTSASSWTWCVAQKMSKICWAHSCRTRRLRAVSSISACFTTRRRSSSTAFSSGGSVMSWRQYGHRASMLVWIHSWMQCLWMSDPQQGITSSSPATALRQTAQVRSS